MENRRNTIWNLFPYSGKLFWTDHIPDGSYRYLLRISGGCVLRMELSGDTEKKRQEAAYGDQEAGVSFFGM